MKEDRDAANYKTIVSDLYRYAKQLTSIQEQLAMSLKHGGDSRPWKSMFRRAKSVEANYENLVIILRATN